MIEERINIVDLRWSQQGDFIIKNGDISDTSNKPAEGFLQEVADRIKSSFGDWASMPDRGANIDSFFGAINDENTWDELEMAIEESLTKNYFLFNQDFNVLVAPLSIDEVGIRIDFDTSLTATIPDSTMILKAIYSFKSNEIYIVR
jgi:hypothetical protein